MSWHVGYVVVIVAEGADAPDDSFALSVREDSPKGERIMGIAAEGSHISRGEGAIADPLISVRVAEARQERCEGDGFHVVVKLRVGTFCILVRFIERASFIRFLSASRSILLAWERIKGHDHRP